MPENVIYLVLITLTAAIVNGGLGYGFSSITVPLALLFLSNRVLNPALVLVEVALNSYVLLVNRDAVPSVWRRVGLIIIGLVPGVVVGTLDRFSSQSGVAQALDICDLASTDSDSSSWFSKADPIRTCDRTSFWVGPRSSLLGDHHIRPASRRPSEQSRIRQARIPRRVGAHSACGIFVHGRGVFGDRPDHSDLDHAHSSNSA